MNNDILVQKILVIQREYKNLLISLLPKVNSNSPYAALDEICIFWKRNVKVVQLFLKHYISGKDSYVFTAATYLDFENNEHYPFLLLGKHHILDDPLCAYLNLYGQMEPSKITDALLAQIKNSIDDNIKIIDNCFNSILILPLRILNQAPNDQTLYELGEDVFLSLFSDIKSISEVTQIKSISVIQAHLRPRMEDIIVFSEKENYELPFIERFQQGVEENPFTNTENTDGYNFCLMVYSYIQQSIDVVLSCMEYGCIPYLRYPVALHYAGLLLENMADQFDVDEMRMKMFIAHLIHEICDKDRLSHSGLPAFLRKKESFENSIQTRFQSAGITADNMAVRVVAPILSECLDELYVAIQEAEQ